MIRGQTILTLVSTKTIIIDLGIIRNHWPAPAAAVVLIHPVTKEGS